METKITKEATRLYVKKQLGTNEAWAKKSLLKIFDFQTQHEKDSEQTHDHNDVGFSGVDGEILTSFAKQLISKKWLSPKQMAIVYRKMPKYWMQIIGISDEEKLKNQVAASLVTEEA